MQHLNLYTQLEHKAEIIFSAKQQTWTIAAFAVLLIIFYLIMWVKSNKLEVRLNALQQQQMMISDELEQLKNEKRRLQANSTVDSELKLLQKDIAFRRKLLGSVNPNVSQGKGFSEYLAGLARQHIDGMWLTEIQLLQGGEQLALAGRTQKPEYIPQYLQKLAKETMFNGHQFSVLRINAEKDNTGILDFVLRANDVE